MATNLGPVYMLMGIITLLFLLALAVSKYGNLVMGNEDEEPEYVYLAGHPCYFAVASGLLLFYGEQRSGFTTTLIHHLMLILNQWRL